MITLNIILFAILCFSIVIIVIDCLEQYHEIKLTKEFMKTLKDKGEDKE